MPDQTAQPMALYRRIYFAGHTRHVVVPKRNRVLNSHKASVLDHLAEIEPTGLLALIDRLARGGYVIRGRDVKDGRRVNLRLTKAGVRIKSEKSVLDPVRVKTVLAQLTAEERKEAIHGLALLARASGQAMQ
jgi:DNA-binding MarR family transcriptional regulator